MSKATNLKLTPLYLASRSSDLIKRGYEKPKWIVFCEALLSRGLTVHLYEARKTFSKYVTATDASGRSFKVRFSNHKPIPSRESRGDCDFFVGVTNQKVTTTNMALDATLKFFGLQEVA